MPDDLAGEWRKTSENPPAVHEDVLGYWIHADEESHMAIIYRLTDAEDGKRRWHAFVEPDYWLPLPEPPKAEEE